MDTLENRLGTLLNELDVAQITGMSVATVRRRRLLKKGPRYIKIGAAVRYPKNWLEEFLDSCPTGGNVDKATV